jgi:superfamily I DNA/RNA helicase
MSETDKKYHEFYEQAYASLDETQRIAVDHIEGPVMVIGGPGTGKTKVLCTRVAKVVLKTASAPGSILCITHRDYTAAAIRRCLLAMAGPGAYQVNVYSFESFCREIIQDNPFVFGDISTRPVNGLDNLEAIKRGKNYHDTQSQVNCVVSAFEENKNLLAIYQEKCRYIFIDEYEDTPGLENRLVTLLASSSEKPNLFVAADDDQAIYPDPSTRLTGFASAYAKHLLTVVLKKNYRFSQPIPDMSTSLISMNSQRFINVFNAQAREPAVCNPTGGQHTPHTVIMEYETRQEEIIATINQAQQLITDGTAPHKIAVIYRGDKYGQQLAEHFSVKNLPVYSSRSLNILEMPLIKKLVRILHYLAAELHLPYSGDNLLFEILHFDFFNIPR